MFYIDTSSGELYLKDAPDYELKSSYSLEVLSTSLIDNSNAQARVFASELASDDLEVKSRSVTINVNNLPEDQLTSTIDNPPQITSFATSSVDENAPLETVIYKVEATDPENDTITYSLEMEETFIPSYRY